MNTLQIRILFVGLLFALGLSYRHVAAAVSTLPVSANADRLAAGQRIYREGITSSGAPLRASTAGQTQLSGKEVACVACHRRSGYGSTEGQTTVRPITAAALFEDRTLMVRSPRIKAQLGSRQRPAYSAQTLARAIRQGLDSSDKPLESLMPRFILTDDDMASLILYLNTLSLDPSPGVDDQEIHFATVVDSKVAPQRRRAMLEVMQAFFKDKGANVRQEELRRDAGNMRMYRAYRKWVLHVWELQGSPGSWPAQLEAYYRNQPVFALVGGLGLADWAPVHAFSERFEVPAVFAQVGLPVTQGENNYNLYLTRGVALQVDVLASFLQNQGATQRVIQVYRADATGLAASARLRAALASRLVIDDLVLTGVPDASFWNKLMTARADGVVLWLTGQELVNLPPDGFPVPTYLAFDFLGQKLPTDLGKRNGNMRLVYPSDLSPKHESRLLRNKIWLRSKGIAVSDEAVQMNTLFAMTVVSDALGHLMDSFSRDYFVERIEHAVAQTPTPSFYPGVSLGQGQRFAAKGASVVTLVGGDKPQFKSLSEWIVP